MALLTKLQKEAERLDAVVYREWTKLTANPNNSKTAVAEELMRKHGVKSRSTIWKMCKRAEARIQAANSTYYGDDDSRAE